MRTTAALSSIPTFGRFFSLLSALTAREINHAELGREFGVDRKTAVFWTPVRASPRPM
ncbi:MAG: hypothetical protein RBU30_17925 [Polyangia bacterium]|nr:hypothetical protein [Polyangia bacterium]